MDSLHIRIKQKTDTQLNWSTNNPILLEGEIGYEIDTGKFKIGDGNSHWSDLEYTLLSEIPTRVSQLSNDSGFLNRNDIIGKQDTMTEVTNEEILSIFNS